MVWTTYNGELYNAHALCLQLQRIGYCHASLCRTHYPGALMILAVSTSPVMNTL
jgi:hypothetical protein